MSMLMRALFLLFLLGCNVSFSHAALFGDDEAREQINALRKQVSELEARIVRMEQALNNQALLELYDRVETHGQELGKLNGQIELLGNDNSLMQKRQRDFYIDLDNRLRSLEHSDHKKSPSSHSSPKTSPQSMNIPAVVPEPAAVPAATAQAVEPAMAADETGALATSDGQSSMTANELIPAGSVENSAYKEAYDLFKSGPYANAITQFESFLDNYPQSSLAPAAAYWVGNSRYAMRDFQQAIDAQKRLINKYPGSSKIPDAFLNIASSQLEMGDSKGSKHTLENIVNKYPNSEAAKKAKSRLANIK